MGNESAVSHPAKARREGILGDNESAYTLIIAEFVVNYEDEMGGGSNRSRGMWQEPRGAFVLTRCPVWVPVIIGHLRLA